MNLYYASKTDKGPSQAHDFKTMIEILHKYNFPTVWSWVTEVESSFRWYLPIHSKYKELGVWQITEGTRNYLGISAEDSKVISKATDAAARYYKELMAKDPHNIPMALAAYNMGPKNRDRGMKILMKAGFGSNFWKLCDMNLNTHTCNYVSEIISGMILSLDPKGNGMPNMEPMEAQ